MSKVAWMPLNKKKTPFKTENKKGFKGSLFALKIRKLKTF